MLLKRALYCVPDGLVWAFLLPVSWVFVGLSVFSEVYRALSSVFASVGLSCTELRPV